MISKLDTETYDLCFLPFLGFHTRLLEQLLLSRKAKKIISHTLQSPTPYKQALKKGYMALNKLRGVTYVPLVLHQHEIWNYLNLLTPLKISKRGFTLSPNLSESMHQKALDSADSIDLPAPFFTVQCAVSNAQKSPKPWPLSHWETLTQTLLEQTLSQAIFVGSEEEKSISQSVINALPEHLQQRCLNLSGKTNIYSLMGILKRSRFFVGADSGIAHLSAALDQKTLVLWGPSPWSRCHPMGANTHFANLGMACSPCIGIFKHTDQQAYDLCPYEHRCMADLSPDFILELLARHHFLKS